MKQFFYVPFLNKVFYFSFFNGFSTILFRSTLCILTILKHFPRLWGSLTHENKFVDSPFGCGVLYLEACQLVTHESMWL